MQWSALAGTPQVRVRMSRNLDNVHGAHFSAFVRAHCGVPEIVLRTSLNVLVVV